MFKRPLFTEPLGGRRECNNRNFTIEGQQRINLRLHCWKHWWHANLIIVGAATDYLGQRQHVINMHSRGIEILGAAQVTLGIEKVAQLPPMPKANPHGDAGEERDYGGLQKALNVECAVVADRANFIDKPSRLVDCVAPCSWS